jgi:hypothetical protein
MTPVPREPGGLSVACLPAIGALSLWNMFRPDVYALAAAGLLTLVLMLVERHRLTPSLRRMALVLGTLTVVLLFVSPTPAESLRRGVAIGTLMASLIGSVTLLARAALRSQALRVVTAHLLAQAAPRRYFSFSLACQLFGGMLGLAGVNLLMNMAAQDETALEDDRIAMFVAITRSFSAATLWSPMFSNTAVLVALYPGLTWFALLPLALLLAAATVGIGVGLDRWRLHGRLPAPAAPAPAEPLAPALRAMLVPMSAFLALVIALAGLLHVAVAAAIILLAPLAALSLNLVLAGPGGRWRRGLRKFGADVASLPAMSGEVTLFMVAGCGGTVIASAIPLAWTAAVGAVLSTHALLAVLALMLSVVALATVAVHPVLSAVLIASSFPPALLHLPPLPHLCAILVGWAVAGAFTPFSIVNLMASRYSGVPLATISTRANAVFALLSLALAACALGTLSSLTARP